MKSHWVSNLTHSPAVLQNIKPSPDSGRVAPRASNHPPQSALQVWVLSGRRIFSRLLSNGAPPEETKPPPRAFVLIPLPLELLLVDFVYGGYSEQVCLQVSER